MLTQLSREDRLQLMKFVCSFVWADLRVRDREAAFVRALIEHLGLAEGERELVEQWLEVPPAPEEVDPAQVPRAHKELFLDVVRAAISADGEVAADEAEVYALFEDLLDA